MAAHYYFNRRQTIFMSFRVILSNTTSLSSFPCEDMHVQGSATARRVQAMIAHLTWMIYLGQSCARAHHACASTENNEAGEDAVTLNTLIAPCINEIKWLPSVVVMKGAKRGVSIPGHGQALLPKPIKAKCTGSARTLQSRLLLILYYNICQCSPYIHKHDKRLHESEWPRAPMPMAYAMPWPGR